MSSFPRPFRRAALRVFPVALAALALLAAAPTLRADSITYDVTLSPTHGAFGGTGTITLASAPSTSGTVTYSEKNGNLEGLTFTIDDKIFNLAGDPDASVLFTNGKLTSVNFVQTVDHAPARFTLELYKGFEFYGNDFGHPESYGSFSAAPVVLPETPAALAETTSPQTTPSTHTASPTPEPGSLLLLATALLAGGYLLLRRKRPTQS